MDPFYHYGVDYYGNWNYHGKLLLELLTGCVKVRIEVKEYIIHIIIFHSQ